MNKPEVVNAGPWSVNFDPNIPDQSKQAYLALVEETANYLNIFGYTMMDINHLPCFMAVKAWTNLADHFTSFEFGQTFLSFDEQVADSYGISESGQIALRITKPDQETKTSLTLDLAAYIFKFKYPQMPIVIGNEEFTGGIMSQLYSNTNNQEIKIKARFY